MLIPRGKLNAYWRKAANSSRRFWNRVEFYMKKLTEVWLRAAHEDYVMAQKAMEVELYRQVCFHSQQCAERIMKAVIRFISSAILQILVSFLRVNRERKMLREHWKSPVSIIILNWNGLEDTTEQVRKLH